MCGSPIIWALCLELTMLTGNIMDFHYLSHLCLHRVQHHTVRQEDRCMCFQAATTESTQKAESMSKWVVGFFFLFSPNRISLRSSGCPRTLYVDQAACLCLPSVGLTVCTTTTWLKWFFSTQSLDQRLTQASAQWMSAGQTQQQR